MISQDNQKTIVALLGGFRRARIRPAPAFIPNNNLRFPHVDWSICDPSAISSVKITSLINCETECMVNSSRSANAAIVVIVGGCVFKKMGGKMQL